MEGDVFGILLIMGLMGIDVSLLVGCTFGKVDGVHDGVNDSSVEWYWYYDEDDIWWFILLVALSSWSLLLLFPIYESSKNEQILLNLQNSVMDTSILSIE